MVFQMRELKVNNNQTKRRKWRCPLWMGGWGALGVDCSFTPSHKGDERETSCIIWMCVIVLCSCCLIQMGDFKEKITSKGDFYDRIDCRRA